jgi:dihydroneopterin aldolase
MTESARVVLSGLSALGRHGASPGERLEPQEFVVDIDVSLDVAEDSLDSTVDYRVLARAATETVETTSFELLETLAVAVARALYKYSGVTRATVVVHKPAAARSVGADDVLAEVTIS